MAEIKQYIFGVEYAFKKSSLEHRTNPMLDPIKHIHGSRSSAFHSLILPCPVAEGL